MNNIPEYYQWEAERCDNSEIVRGYLAHDDRIIDPIDENGDMYMNEYGVIDGRAIMIKPETVRRLTVKPKFIESEFGAEVDLLCPNCGQELFGTKVCHGCGMAIDWSGKSNA